MAAQTRWWDSNHCPRCGQPCGNHCPRCGHKFRSSRAQDESAWFPPLSLSIPWLRLWGQHLGMRWRIPHRHSHCGQITLYLLTHCSTNQNRPHCHHDFSTHRNKWFDDAGYDGPQHKAQAPGLVEHVHCFFSLGLWGYLGLSLGLNPTLWLRVGSQPYNPALRTQPYT